MEKLAIIDDEQNNLELIQYFLEKHIPNISIIGTAYSVKTGVKLLKENNISVVFLDIELEDGTGFDILRKVNDPKIAVIFTTAYTQYAIEAIKLKNYPVDYIVKPIIITDLVEAYNRILKKKKVIENTLSNPSKILIKLKNRTEIVNYISILFIEASGRYSIIHLIGQENIKVSKSLVELLASIKAGYIIRTHRSYAVNIHHINKYEYGKSVLMRNNKRLPISKKYLNNFNTYF